ncbi:MAG: hypothetical protein ACRD9Q_01680, partial [Nitrososphaeraceae archaeon]
METGISESKDVSKMTQKITDIAEILAILNDTNRGKDWLLQEVKKHRLKSLVKPTMNSFEMLKALPDDFISNLLKSLQGADVEGFEDVQTLTKTFHWFFTDIVAGSNPTIPTKDQVRKITVLNELISRTETFRKKDPDSTVILPTGDGMAIGFSDSPEKPIRLAVELHKLINKYNELRSGTEKLLIRVGIDMGPVYVIKDLNNKDNVWGPGIILTRRVMDLAGDMNILASARIAGDTRKLSPEYKEIIHPIGDYSIKHGEELQIYNIYGNGFGNKIAPRSSKVEKLTEDKLVKPSYNFAFRTIDIVLDVIEPTTMLTRHTWVWKLENISKEPKEQVHYVIDGDKAKEFKDLHVTVKDERGNNLEILTVDANKPMHKEFNVKLRNPILPKQVKTIKLEYDWEEPDRNFYYRVASDCKEFTYLFTISKEAQIKTRVLRVDAETGYRVYASPNPVIKYLDDKTVVSWSKSNLKAFDA